ncbi:hypothetical protein BGZ99_000515 [Dissophora globulifera]|uniref:Transcription initiation factor TFIID subunit 4 n=1 Tax=Dissophora globulifera TaxID=979702 RepID=A0A9P6V0F8_9FUNG|nr:hypothetical protein BGZ99_000515 [Dissophora globulifera]
MHGTVDDLLSAEFPLGMSNVQHSSETLNNGVQGNIMEGLDDLFSDDYTPIGATASSNHTMATLHMPSHPQHTQALTPTLQFPSTSHSPQKQPSPMPPHRLLQEQNRILQQPSATGQDSPSAVPARLPGHPGSIPGVHHAGHQPQQLPMTPSHLSQSPHLSPAASHVTLSAQSILPTRPQQPSSLAQQFSPQPAQHLQPSITNRPAFQQQSPMSGLSLAQAQAVQAQALAQAQAQSLAANGPGDAPSIPIAQAGSPLHHILSSVPPGIAQQVTNLFALLQTNAVTPSEFLARAKTLLDGPQFEILDSIRRRHGGAVRPTGDGAQPSPTVSAANSTPGTPSPSAATSATPTASATSVQAGRVGGIQGVSLPSATPSTALPTLSQPQSTSIAATSLPPTSSLQSAPVRKRNTDSATTSTAPSESKVASKRVKTDHQLTGANGPTAYVASPSVPPSFPSTPGPSTPGGVSSPGVFNRVSLPGQQKGPAATPGAGPAAGTAGGAIGAGGGAGGSGAGAGGSGASRSSASNMERTNYDNITDVMGYVGVDLKEESDNIMRDNDGYTKSGGGSDGQDRTRVQNFISAKLLKEIVERIAKSHKLDTFEPDVLAYLAMATQERLRGLSEQMILASKHRGRAAATAPPPMYDENHPMYKVVITHDTKRQLLAIERVEREEETKRKEQIAERERRLAAGEDLDENGEPRMASGAGAGGAGGLAGAGGGGPKKGKKPKEGGPGVSARNMTEEARKKVANQTALGFAGGSGRTYSWMMGSGGAGGGGGGGGDGGAASPLPSVSTPGASSSGAAGVASAGSPSASGSVGVPGASGSAKPALSRGGTISASLAAAGSGGSVGGVGSPGGVSGVFSTSTLTLPSAGAAGVGGGASAAPLGSPPASLTRGSTAAGGGSMILPPSTVGRPSGLRDGTRKVNVKDALFCLERDRGGGGGEGSGQRVLIKSYVKWLK